MTKGQRRRQEAVEEWKPERRVRKLLTVTKADAACLTEEAGLSGKDAACQTSDAVRKKGAVEARDAACQTRMRVLVPRRVCLRSILASVLNCKPGNDKKYAAFPLLHSSLSRLLNCLEIFAGSGDARIRKEDGRMKLHRAGVHDRLEELPLPTTASMMAGTKLCDKVWQIVCNMAEACDE